jgi:hypothetical protein
MGSESYTPETEGQKRPVREIPPIGPDTVRVGDFYFRMPDFQRQLLIGVVTEMDDETFGYVAPGFERDRKFERWDRPRPGIILREGQVVAASPPGLANELTKCFNYQH